MFNDIHVSVFMWRVTVIVGQTLGWFLGWSLRRTLRMTWKIWTVHRYLPLCESLRLLVAMTWRFYWRVVPTTESSAFLLLFSGDIIAIIGLTYNVVPVNRSKFTKSIPVFHYWSKNTPMLLLARDIIVMIGLTCVVVIVNRGKVKKSVRPKCSWSLSTSKLRFARDIRAIIGLTLKIVRVSRIKRR